ncbi:MAG: hypothetical protein HQK53_06135 [Oligoflexia bacterium]|nr:hypothetical protein [Oligoflexia bacterium]
MSDHFGHRTLSAEIPWTLSFDKQERLDWVRNEKKPIDSKKFTEEQKKLMGEWFNQNFYRLEETPIRESVFIVFTGFLANFVAKRILESNTDRTGLNNVRIIILNYGDIIAHASQYTPFLNGTVEAYRYFYRLMEYHFPRPTTNFDPSIYMSPHSPDAMLSDGPT